MGKSLAEFEALPDDERDLWAAKHDRERDRCSCGNDRERCHDPEVAWFPQRDVCYATMAKLAAERLYARLHEDRGYHDGTFTSWAEKASASHPYHAGDGVTIWVAEVDAAPHDEFTTDASASPIAEGGGSDSD